MTVRLNVVLSDDLDRDLDLAAKTNQTTKSEIMRKAMQVYLSALEGKANGLKLGLADPKTKILQTEFVGL